MQDALEVVVEVETPLLLDILEELLALLGLGDREDHHGGDAATPVFALEVQVQLAVVDIDIKDLFLKVRFLILVEGVFGRQILGVPEAIELLAEGSEVHGVGDHRLALGQDRSFAVDLELAPESRGAVHVDEDTVRAVGHIHGQAALFDADEILVEGIRLEGVEGAPDLGIFQPVTAALAVQGAGSDRREAVHDRAGAQAEVEGV